MSAAAMTYVASVCSPDDELIGTFMRAFGESDRAAKVAVRDMAEVCLEPVSLQSLAEESTMARLRDADICIMLVRHLDAGSLDRLRDMVRRLPSIAMQNLQVTICRKPGENEYKISCSKCHQNLVVSDALTFLRVRCPQCHDVFTVPAQTDVLRNGLVLNASRHVRKITIGDSHSCFEALANMIGQVIQRNELVKHATMRIELPHVLVPS